MGKKMLSCPICEEKALFEKEIEKEFHFKGKMFLIKKFPVMICDSCGESFINEKKMKSVEKEIKGKQKEIENLLSSSEIKSIRESLGVSQSELSLVLGGGAKGFSRYENGNISQSKPMDNLLRILRQFPTLIFYLKEDDCVERKKESEWISASSFRGSVEVVCNTLLPNDLWEKEPYKDYDYFPFPILRNYDDEKNGLSF